jgi:hypothetical protein
MYIDPFWCGVIATILAEVAMVIVSGVYTNWKKRK